MGTPQSRVWNKLVSACSLAWASTMTPAGTCEVLPLGAQSASLARRAWFLESGVCLVLARAGLYPVLVVKTKCDHKSSVLSKCVTACQPKWDRSHQLPGLSGDPVREGGVWDGTVFSLCFSVVWSQASSPWRGWGTGGKGWLMLSGWVAAASSAGGNCFLSRQWELLDSAVGPAAAG